MKSADARAVAIGLAAVGLGLAAESASFGWSDLRDAVPDLITGCTLVACGLLARARRPRSSTGALLIAAGFAWFAGNFAFARSEPLAWVASHLAYVHRGLLLHAVLSFPTGRLPSRALAALVAAGYAVALVPVAASGDTATMIFGLAIVTAALAVRVPARGAAVLFGATLAAAAALRMAFPPGGADRAALLVYQAGTCLVAVDLLSDLVSRPRGAAAVADLVVELTEHRAGTLRDALARVLGDPTLEVVYWGERGTPLDAAGRPVPVPRPAPGRSVTTIDRGGEPVAVLVHDAAVLEDPDLMDAVASAARLEAANSRLQAEVRRHVAELETSRRRLLRIGDEERRRLELRLREGPQRSLDSVAALLGEARALADGDPADEALERARRQLEHTRGDLGAVARGLHPRALAEGGLHGGLRDLATASPVPVTVTAGDFSMPRDAQVATYFVCAEALANAVKHARARRVEITMCRRDTTVAVEIRDDGVGGADPDAGSGLRGLAERLAALGGSLRVESADGQGTVVSAAIPLGEGDS